MNNKKLSILFLANLLLTICMMLSLFFFREKKTVYVDSLRLFKDFRMTKELMYIGDKEFQKKKSSLDSLYKYVETVSDKNEKEKIVKEIIAKRQDIEMFQGYYNTNNSDKIWKRINNYLKDFSSEEGYGLIIGSQSNRDVFSADENLNVTDKALKYINKRYEGFN